MIRISHHIDYPLLDLEQLLLPLFKKYHTADSLRVTIKSANHIWCAHENDKCIGSILTTDIGSHGGLYIILFGVSRMAQGRGIGTCLLESVVDWCRENSYTFIYLHTEHENKHAIRLYEKIGFQKDFYQPDYLEQLPHYESDVLSLMLLL